MSPVTTTAATLTTENASKLDLYTFLSNPIVLAFISSGIIIGVITFLIKFVFKLGAKDTEISNALVDIGELKTDVKKLGGSMDRIIGHLATSDGISADLFAGSSPLQLLEKGIKLLDESGFKEVYKDNKDWFIKEIKQYKIKTLADVDDASFKIMEKCRNDAKFVNLKEMAFEKGVNLDVLLRVLSIYLRGELAKEVLVS